MSLKCLITRQILEIRNNLEADDCNHHFAATTSERKHLPQRKSRDFTIQLEQWTKLTFSADVTEMSHNKTNIGDTE